MKALIRVAVAMLLVAPFAVHRVERLIDATESNGTTPSWTTLSEIRSNGELRLAVVSGSLAFFFHQGAPAGFEYDLLGEFASQIDASLKPVSARSAGEAAALLRSGAVDLAVIPISASSLDGLAAVASYVPQRRGRTRWGLPPTGALYVRTQSRRLLVSLNSFLRHAGRDGTTRVLYRRYFGEPGRFRVIPASGRRLRLSEFDSIIVRAARSEGLDWRLVAAVISAESRFDAKAVSPVGATGLMQLMPIVGQEMAIRNLHDPESNIRAGARYLHRLMEMFPGPDGQGNLPLMLASYVMGPGHVLDARQLAIELELDPDLWEGNLDRILPLLEQPEHYQRLRLGYAQGRLAVRYVNQVLERYEIYKQHFSTPRDGEQAAATARTPMRTASNSGQQPPGPSRGSKRPA